MILIDIASLIDEVKSTVRMVQEDRIDFLRGGGNGQLLSPAYLPDSSILSNIPVFIPPNFQE